MDVADESSSGVMHVQGAEPYSLNAEPSEPGDDPPFDVPFGELYDLAKATFESAGEAAAWLRRPHPMLKGESPLKCARSRTGAQRVIGVLIAIREGELCEHARLGERDCGTDFPL